MEALYLAEVEQYQNIYLLAPGLDLWGYKQGNYGTCTVAMFLLGFVFRVVAYLAIRFVK